MLNEGYYLGNRDVSELQTKAEFQTLRYLVESISKKEKDIYFKTEINDRISLTVTMKTLFVDLITGDVKIKGANNDEERTLSQPFYSMEESFKVCCVAIRRSVSQEASRNGRMHRMQKDKDSKNLRKKSYIG